MQQFFCKIEAQALDLINDPSVVFVIGTVASALGLTRGRGADPISRPVSVLLLALAAATEKTRFSASS